MPLVLQTTASLHVGSLSSCCVDHPWLAGAEKALVSRRRLNAMFIHLKRWSGSSMLWDRALRSRDWREQVTGQVAGLRTNGYFQQRVENHGLRISSGIIDSVSGVESNVASCRLRVSTLRLVDRGWRIVRNSDLIGEHHELGLRIITCGRLSSYVPAAKRCLQVSTYCKGPQRKSEFASCRHFHKATIIHEYLQSKRISGVASRSQTPVETSDSQAVIRKGSLLEFERESGQIILVVAKNRDGKKNWLAVDQSGNVHSIRPKQITYLVPCHEDFDPSDIVNFLVKVEKLQDPSLLEFAWEEVSGEKVVEIESLAKILYSKGTPMECYSVHRMLSDNQIYFRCRQQGLTPVYEPRPLSQVRELQQKRLADEKAHEQLLSYVKAIELALQCPQYAKPSKSMWDKVDHLGIRTESLKAYALSSQIDPAQKRSAEEVIEAMGLTKNSAVVVSLLIGMGVFPIHVNIELLKVKDLVEFREEHIAAVEQLRQSPPCDPDVVNRVDLTEMKVYTIDSDDTDEIDDGLSATRLPDGRLKVWIHVADPTRLLPLGHILSREAEVRGTSIYLPTGTIPMFPIELAAGEMSLQQGCTCCAVTVSVVLSKDGSIAEYSVMNSMIRPTYKLSYDNVAELLMMDVEEEPELYLLAEAATCRVKWRTSQGAICTNVPEVEVKVTDPGSAEPTIILDVKDQSSEAMQLVAEMMILCGEVVALLGEEHGLILPYRGQAQTEFPKHQLSTLPEGPCRAFGIRRLLGSADMSFTKPIAHASLGLPGYVQFTSPIRRFADLIAHYQVKAFVRGDVPPFSCGNMEAKMAIVNIRTKDARRLQTSAMRYWILEYLRRQPRDREYQALILRYLKDKEASVLLLEVGIRGYVVVTPSSPVGSEILVVVYCADPRKDILSLRHC